MIKRELYMSRIRPFIGTELIKVMTGIRRCGKSVMLELIKQELTESGVSPTQFVSINFEDMSYSHLQTAQALQPCKGKILPFIGTRNAVITRRSGKIGRKAKRRTGDIFLHIRPEMQQKMKQPSAYPLDGHADGCVFHQSFHSILEGGKIYEIRYRGRFT